MNIKKYILASADFHLVSDAEQVGAVRALFDVIKIRREELRADIEAKPVLCDDKKDDAIFKLGIINGLNFILGLPQRSRDFMNSLEEGE